MNQVVSREEVAALLQGMAAGEANRQEPLRAKKPKGPDDSYKSETARRGRRACLANSSRKENGVEGFLPSRRRQ